MRHQTASIIRLLFVLSVTYGLCSSAFSEDRSTGCSAATLNGTYGFYWTGTTLEGPLVSVGILNYDGKGNFTAKQHISRNGKFEYLTGSYKVEVAPNCTSKSFQDGAMVSWDTIVDNGNRIVLMSRVRGTTVYGLAEKIHKKTSELSSSTFSDSGCSEATLNGAYGFRRSGVNLDGPLVGVGILVYDGKGNSWNRQSVSRNGSMEVVTGTGEVQVAEDCTTKGLLTWGVIVDNGNRVFFMSRVPTITVYGISEKIHQQ